MVPTGPSSPTLHFTTASTSDFCGISTACWWVSPDRALPRYLTGAALKASPLFVQDLLSSQFNVTLGDKLSEHLKKWIDVTNILQPPQPASFERGSLEGRILLGPCG